MASLSTVFILSTLFLRDPAVEGFQHPAHPTPLQISSTRICSRHPSQRTPVSQKNRKSELRASFDENIADDLFSKIQNVELKSISVYGNLGDEDQSLFSFVESTVTSLTASFLALSLTAKLTIIIPSLVAITLSALYTLSNPPPDYRDGYEPYPRGQYDPQVAKAYYSQHPLLVLRRVLQLLRISNQFIIKILIDNYITKNEEENRLQRSEELLDIIQKAGPTAIKVGQALSVRPDLIPIEYADTLSTLQDRVPPFPSKQAKTILREELLDSPASGSLNDIFSEIDTKTPVASASIGQVYKATLKSGREVAVKVQRPDALSSIALDLYIVKEYFAPLYKLTTRSATDFVSLANEWGRGFIAELDYSLEKKNTRKFNEDMKRCGMYDVVQAPKIVDEYCTKRILTTEWIDGTRLDESLDQDDVPRLCGVALNAYLVMLLETGVLHCDPHPGNLLRTKDGTLCILDFGMTLETDPLLQYDILEFVAHLTSRDYDEIPEDLVALGFLKEERLETVKASGFLTPLTYMLQQASEGGGADKVRERIYTEFRDKYPGLEDEELRVVMRQDMKDAMKKAQQEASAISGITLEVEELQKRNRDAFRIPEWFLYTSRAFLTLEGICLQADEDFSLIQSCFPYVAKRLLKDDSERAQQALRDLLYGAGEMVDVDRLSDVAEGFSTYTTATKTKTSSKTPFSVTETAITLAKDSAEILLSSKPNLAQNLLLTESAAATTASLKDSLKRVLVTRPQELRNQIPFLPGQTIEKKIEQFLEKSEEESQAQVLISKLNVNRGAENGAPSRRSLEDVDAEQVALVVKELRENLPKYAPLVRQLSGKFASTVLERTSQDINQKLQKSESNGEHDNNDRNEFSSLLVNSLAKGVSGVASQSADVINRRQQQRQEEKTKEKAMQK